MPVILLQTLIPASIERCFDLARSIDLHIESTSHTREKAIDGCLSGLIGPGEFVTWRACHLGVWQQLSTSITAYRYPVFFADTMTKGIFKFMHHEHCFEAFTDGSTLMTDHFRYQSPWGILGRIADILFLKAYMERLLLKRNAAIKEYAETERWKEILNP